jgi:hypothetical protein
MSDSPVNCNGIWRTKYSNELYKLYDELDIVKVVKIGRLKWLGEFCRTQELDPCRRFTLLHPEGNRRVGKPHLRWFEAVEEDLRRMGWREKMERLVEEPRIVEGSFGRGYGSERTVMSEEETK